MFGRKPTHNWPSSTQRFQQHRTGTLSLRRRPTSPDQHAAKRERARTRGRKAIAQWGHNSALATDRTSTLRLRDSNRSPSLPPICNNARAAMHRWGATQRKTARLQTPSPEATSNITAPDSFCERPLPGESSTPGERGASRSKARTSTGEYKRCLFAHRTNRDGVGPRAYGISSN